MIFSADALSSVPFSAAPDGTTAVSLVIEAVEVAVPWIEQAQTTTPWAAVAEITTPWIDQCQATTPWIETADVTTPWIDQAQSP